MHAGAGGENDIDKYGDSSSSAAGVKAVLGRARSMNERGDRATTRHLGNEACDMESVASSVALAYAHPSSGGRAVAVLSATRSQLHYRLYLGNILREAGVDATVSTRSPCPMGSCAPRALAAGSSCWSTQTS